MLTALNLKYVIITDFSTTLKWIDLLRVLRNNDQSEITVSVCSFLEKTFTMTNNSPRCMDFQSVDTILPSVLFNLNKLSAECERDSYGVPEAAAQ